VHTIDDPIVFNGTLKEYEDILIERNFYRSNSGYLINLHHLVAIDGDDCHMSSGEYLKVSRSRKKGLLEALTNYIGGKHL
jgi:DNA-binding LytR/AlgR family response regulator